LIQRVRSKDRSYPKIAGKGIIPEKFSGMLHLIENIYVDNSPQNYSGVGKKRPPDFFATKIYK
jgi:hypothetical protein